MWKKLGQKISEGRGIWAVAPGVAGVVIAMRLCGWLQPWEWTALDQYFRWRPLEPPDERIVIVGINEVDLKKVGQWPIPDAVLAEVIEKVKAQKPIAIGLDIYRDLPVKPGHNQLVQVFQTTPNLIGIEKINQEEPDAAVAPSPVLEQLDQVGFNNLVVDFDGKLRRALLYMTKGDQPMASFAMRLAMLDVEDPNIVPQPARNHPEILYWGKTILQPFNKNDGGYVGADDGGYQIILNYRGPARTFPKVSMTQVLENQIPKGLMSNRIVLIGTTATSLNDLFYTPYSGDRLSTSERTPGVEIQANIISHLLNSIRQGRPGIRTLPELVEWLWITFWSFTGATLCWLLRNAGGFGKLLPPWTIVSLLVAVLGLVVSTYLAFVIGGWWIPVVPPVVVLLGAATATTGYIANFERQERQSIMNLFSRHVTKQIAETIWRNRDQLIQEGRLPGRKMIATVLFSDLKGFSSLAEHMEPETLMAWLNEYMDAMARLVLAHNGVVDKFIGDAVMAVFGVPIQHTNSAEIAQDAIAAINCALAMAQELEILNQQWHNQGYPQTAMRIGIATGNVVAGSLGSYQRLDYTILGDTVNVAARLESYDKSIDGGICRILINEETYQYLQNKFPTKLLGRVMLKGREQATAIYQVLH